jgi:transposase
VEQEGPRVVVGMDRHKRSVTIEVMDAEENVLGGGRSGTELTGYRSRGSTLRLGGSGKWLVRRAGVGM